MTFQKTTKRLAHENLSEIEVHNCRCHFRAFQPELDIVDTKNFEIGSVVKKLQPFEVGQNRPKIKLFSKESTNLVWT